MKNKILKITENVLLVKTIKLSLVSLFSNLLGFFIPVYIAFEYNISKQTDSFFLSYNIILFIGVVFSGAVRSVSIPYLQERIGDSFKFNQFVSSVYYIIFFFFLVLSIILSAISYVIYLDTDNVLYWYLFLSSPIILFTVINSFSYGILNSMGQFNVAEMSPFSRAIVIFGMIFMFKGTFGISAVIIGYNLGEFAKFFHLYYVIVRINKIKISFINTQFSLLKEFLIEGSSQILATVISASSPLIDRFVASFLLMGSISLLDYGDKIFVVFNVLLNAFLSILLSKWSKDVISQKFSLKEMNRVIVLIFGISIFLFVCVYFSRDLIVNVLYPKVSVSNRVSIGMILIINMVGFVFNSMSQIVNRAMIALKSTNLMIKTSLIKSIFNIILDIIFANYWGVLGIVYANIGVNLVGLSVNYTLFYRKFKYMKS